MNDSISPSVYVIYSSIQASASCVALFNSHIPIGSAYTAVTCAYEPNVLSSAICEAENVGAGIEYCISPETDQNNPANCFQGIDNGWRQINFTELGNPPPASELLPRYQSCFPGHSINADFASRMFVKPQLAFPPDVTEIDPVWATWGGSTCTPDNLGVFDPPRVLQKATALAPVPTPAADPQAEKAPPSPAASLQSPVAAPTMAVTSADPNTGVKANDPGSNGAGTAAPSTAQSNPGAAIADPVDPSVAAQNEGSSGTVNSNAVNPGSNSNSNSDSDPMSVVVDPADGSVVEQDESSPSPGSNSNSASVASGGNTTPAETEKQSGANAATNPGSNPGTDPGNNDPSTAPITLLPQQPADTSKESSGSSGQTGGSTDGTASGTNGGTNGGTNTGANGDTKDTNDANGGPNGENSTGGTKNGNADPPPIIASINSQPITKDASGNILLPGSTLAPGNTAILSGHTIANVPSAVFLDGSTYAPSAPTPSPTAPPPPLLTNNLLLHQTANSALEIAPGTLLLPGASATVSNHMIAYPNPSQLVQDGTTHNLVPVSSSNPLVLGGQTFSRAPDGGLVVAPGTTVAPGGSATVAGHVYALAGSSSVVVDGGATYALPAATDAVQIQAATPSSDLLTLANGLVLTALSPSSSSTNSPDTPPTYLLPNGAALAPGGTPATYAGTTYTALPSRAGIRAAVGTSTLRFQLPSPFSLSNPLASPLTAAATIAQPVFTAGGAPFTPQATGFPLGTTSLRPGGEAYTAGGTVVSLGPGGTLVVGGGTWVLPSGVGGNGGSGSGSGNGGNAVATGVSGSGSGSGSGNGSETGAVFEGKGTRAVGSAGLGLGLSLVFGVGVGVMAFGAVGL